MLIFLAISLQVVMNATSFTKRFKCKVTVRTVCMQSEAHYFCLLDICDSLGRGLYTMSGLNCGLSREEAESTTFGLGRIGLFAKK